MVEPEGKRHSTFKLVLPIIALIVLVGGVGGGYFFVYEPLTQELSLRNVEAIIVSDHRPSGIASLAESKSFSAIKYDQILTIRVNNGSPVHIDLNRVIIVGYDKNGDSILIIPGSGEKGSIPSESSQIFVLSFQRSYPPPDSIIIWRTWVIFDTKFGELPVITI